jgi:hypothetical protein
MDHQVTLYENFNKDVGHFSLEGIMDDFRLGVYEYLIEPLRQKLREGNMNDYRTAKLSLQAITPCALFNGRRIMPNMVQYNHIIILDFDKLTEDELKRLKTLICLCDYTLACFVSPSGNGLKVFVSVSTGAEDHKRAFLAVQQFYQALTGVEIDPSGKDINRLCFVSFDPKLYYNPKATVFVPLQGLNDQGVSDPEGSRRVVSTPLNDQDALDPERDASDPERSRRVVSTSLNDQGLTPLNDQGLNDSNEIPTWATAQPVSQYDSKSIIETIQRCKNYVERNCSFTEGQRNTFLFALAIQFRCAGFNESFTLMELLQDYNFDEREVRNCVRSAFGYVWKDNIHVGNTNENINKSPESNVGVALVAAKGENVDIPINEERQPQGRPLHFQQSPSDLQQSPVELPPSPPVPPPPKEKKSRKAFNLKKAELFLKLWYEFRYNVVTGMVEWRHAKTDEPFKRLEDYDENSMLVRLHHADQLIPINMLHVLIYSNFSPDFNPFKEYIDSLKYDGETDYIGQLSDTVHSDDDDYWKFCFRKWFVAYVASLVVDEIINHTVIVFVGIQGVGKTSWMKLLVPRALRKYLGTAALQTDSKDTSIQISECALILLDEMENLNRKDLASFKELITRPEMRIRRPYGRNSENLPHRASFIAAVNYMQILTDPSGSRRYLCSNVNSLDFDHTVDIDGAIAQAYSLFRSGFRFWFDQDEIHELTERNEDFMSKTIEEELIETWLEPVTLDEWKSKDQFMSGMNIQLMTATQIAVKLMEKAKLTLGDNTIVKIGKVLHKLGYVRVRKRNNYVYLIRIVDVEAVDRSSRTMDVPVTVAPGEPMPSDLKKEQEENEQIIRLEEDLSGGSVSDELPF